MVAVKEQFSMLMHECLKNSIKEDVTKKCKGREPWKLVDPIMETCERSLFIYLPNTQVHQSARMPLQVCLQFD
jgi:hypothetical protein